MSKRRIGLSILTSIIILLPIVAGVLLWDQLSPQMPIHWNLKGAVDGMVPKAVAVFGFPAVMLVLHWISTGLTKRESEGKRTFTYWFIPLLTLILSGVMYYSAIV
jgi:uncharacterized membrane protein